MAYILEHTSLGFSIWDLPALIILIAVIVIFIKKHHDAKKEERELEDMIVSQSQDDYNDTMFLH